MEASGTTMICSRFKDEVSGNYRRRDGRWYIYVGATTADEDTETFIESDLCRFIE